MLLASAQTITQKPLHTAAAEASVIRKRTIVDSFEESKLILFIAFVVPGFIAIKAYELLSPSQERDSSSQLIDAVSYSCLNYAVLIWPIYYLEAIT